MRYLGRVRLSRAARYLTTTNLTVSAIAQSTGYDSEASLGKRSSARSASLLASTAASAPEARFGLPT